MRFFPRVRVENRRFSTKIDSSTIVNVRKTVRSSLEKMCDAPIAKRSRKERGVGEGGEKRERLVRKRTGGGGTRFAQDIVSSYAIRRPCFVCEQVLEKIWKDAQMKVT